ncbi:MAG: hypothetical protein ACSHYA_05385 [Opitutaceae bacterium]
MEVQDYNADTAFSRWSSGLQPHLDVIRESYAMRRGLHLPQADLLNHLGDESYLKRYLALNCGVVSWGVFARAFWAIYANGENNFYGSVVVGDHPDMANSPILFEIAEEIRRVRDFDVDTTGIEAFVEIIRDDCSMANRIQVPKSISSGYDVFLQSLRIDRRDLPTGYLHHRLVPVAYSSRHTYSKIVSSKFWSEEFREIWSSGLPPLSTETLQGYAEAWSEIKP